MSFKTNSEASLRVFHEVPEGFLQAKAQDLFDLLGGPSLIHLGQELKAPALFVSTLLHGNEHSSLSVAQRVLLKIANGDLELTRPLIILIGNPAAATEDKRHLPSQMDFNRVWNGGSCQQAKVAQQVLDYAKKHELFCCVDIHNNTGRNPYYSCVNRLDPEYLFLAAHFFRQTVYFTEPHEVLSMAFSKFCPSTTLEIGQSGEEEGINTVTEKLCELLRLEKLDNNFDVHQAELYRSIGRMKLAPTVKVDFAFSELDAGRDSVNFSFLKDVDLFNFQNIPAGTALAKALSLDGFWVEGLQGDELTEQLFSLQKGELITSQSLVPAMITRDIEIAKSDCFGYIMERFVPFS